MPLLKKKPKKLLARIAVRPPLNPSNGAQTISRQLGAIAKLTRRPVLRLQYRTLINWGNSAAINGENPNLLILNKPGAVQRASNKLSAFRAFQESGVRIPLFQTQRPEVRDGMYLARHKLCGSGGDGITIIRKGAAVPDAPLYVKYVPKLIEYRIHVVSGSVIFAQQKKRKSDNEQTEDQKLIRNYDNGWVFCPTDVADLNEDVHASAVAAVAALGLDFGAVDLIIGRDDGLAYVLECNTAPGLSSPGLIEAYTNKFKEIARV